MEVMRFTRLTDMPKTNLFSTNCLIVGNWLSFQNAVQIIGVEGID
jgi:hypothetical protein